MLHVVSLVQQEDNVDAPMRTLMTKSMHIQWIWEYIGSDDQLIKCTFQDIAVAMDIALNMTSNELEEFLQSIDNENHLLDIGDHALSLKMGQELLSEAEHQVLEAKVR